jgi:acyl-coenzyme A thioesterase PaaI-like protein
MTTTQGAGAIPEGYTYEPSTSAFINHVGKVYHKKTTAADGTQEYWVAMRIEEHHVNTWGLGHGGMMATFAEIMTSGPGYEVGGPPVVAVEMSMQFIRAPKLGELLEGRGVAVRRTRSLVFTRADAMVDGVVVFTATSVQKVVGA